MLILKGLIKFCSLYPPFFLFQANMKILSEIDIEYLIDAAEKTSVEDDIPRYIPYICMAWLHHS